MGGITMARVSFVDQFTEIVGFKSGIIITPDQLTDLLGDYDVDLAAKLRPDGPDGFRMYSTEFEDVVAHLLYKLGNIDSPRVMSASAQLYHQFKDDPKTLDRYYGVLEAYIAFMDDVLAGPPPEGGKLDPEPLLRVVAERFGNAGLDMVMALIKGVNLQNHISPWGQVRAIDWKDEVALTELFVSERLETLHGAYFDQRFIDFLERNYGEIGNINWRKFEGIAGEYFDRAGFAVDMGPGRNDDGIDLRIFPKEPVASAPPLIIVQCKRQKAKIDKALVKSVYADVLHEQAGSGLIVTSSYMSPGATTMRTARGYPIEAADRDTLKTWIRKMKSDRLI